MEFTDEMWVKAIHLYTYVMRNTHPPNLLQNQQQDHGYISIILKLKVFVSCQFQNATGKGSEHMLHIDININTFDNKQYGLELCNTNWNLQTEDE